MKRDTVFKTFFVFSTFSFSQLLTAQEATGGAPSPTAGLLVQLPVFLALFALFYFGLIRPQRQQAKQHAEFVSKLGKGDEVILASGFIGKIVGLTDKVASVEIADGVEVKVLKSQIQSKTQEILGTASK